jgi:hypothetical protein
VDIGPDPGLVDRLLELTHDHPWVVGHAINSLARLRGEPDRVVPRLIQLVDEFDEYDPDEGYGGRHARVCRAIEAFGPAAAAAVPRLAAELRRELSDDPTEEPTDLVNALAAIGPAAADALPLLEQLKARYDDGDEPAARIVRAMRQISGR